MHSKVSSKRVKTILRFAAWNGNWRGQKLYASLSVDEEILSRYVGQYGNWIVTLRNGALFMSSGQRKYDWKMIPMTET